MKLKWTQNTVAGIWIASYHDTVIFISPYPSGIVMTWHAHNNDEEKTLKYRFDSVSQAKAFWANEINEA